MPKYLFHSDTNQKQFERALDSRLIRFEVVDHYWVEVVNEGIDSLASDFGGERVDLLREKKK